MKSSVYKFCNPLIEEKSQASSILF